MEESGKKTDDWMERALADPAVVAEMLISLRTPRTEPPKLSQTAAAAFPGSWGVVRKQPRTVMKLGGWCYSEIRHQDEREAEEKEKAGSPLTPLAWNECGGLGGSGEDGSGSSSDDRKVRAERIVEAAGTPDGGNGGRMKAAAGEVYASSLLSKTTPAKKKSIITVLRELESRLLTAKENSEKEIKMLKENYSILMRQNNCLKTLHERMSIVSSEKAAIPAAADESKQGTDGHCQEPIPSEDYRPMALQTSCIADYIRDRASQTHPSFSVRAYNEVFTLPDLNLPVQDDGFAGKESPAISELTHPLASFFTVHR